MTVQTDFIGVLHCSGMHWNDYRRFYKLFSILIFLTESYSSNPEASRSSYSLATCPEYGWLTHLQISKCPRYGSLSTVKCCECCRTLPCFKFHSETKSVLILGVCHLYFIASSSLVFISDDQISLKLLFWVQSWREVCREFHDCYRYF